MRRFLLPSLFILSARSSSDDGSLPIAFLDVTTSSSSTSNHFPSRIFAQVSSFGAMLPVGTPEGAPLRVIVASGDDGWGLGCSSFTPSLPNSSPFAILASRGNCSFTSKALAAQKSGASMLLVYDGLGGKYYSSSQITSKQPLTAGVCDVDCNEYSTTLAATDVTLTTALDGFPVACGKHCNSGLCALTPAASDADRSAPRKACCVPNDYLVLGGGIGADKVIIPVLWLSAGDGAALVKISTSSLSTTAATIGEGTRIGAALRDVASYDPAGIILWVLGCIGAISASYTASHVERSMFLASRKLNGMTNALSPRVYLSPAETVPELTWRSAAAIIIFSSSFLFFLYGLILLKIRIVFLILAIFAFSASSASAALVIGPCLGLIAPWLRTRMIPLPNLIKRFFTYWFDFDASNGIPLETIIAATTSAIGVIIWLTLRHAPGAWAAQDTFALLIAVLSCAQIRLPTMRSAALLLTCLFAYDIFMVFGTPFLIGESVMVEVATAGAPAAIPTSANSATPACYCRTHSDDSAVCSPAELMPILLAWPRADWRGGFSMLGLGDIVVPALALAVALRFDYGLYRRESINRDTETETTTAATSTNCNDTIIVSGTTNNILPSGSSVNDDDDDDKNALISTSPINSSPLSRSGGNGGSGSGGGGVGGVSQSSTINASSPSRLSSSSSSPLRFILDLAALPTRKRGGLIYWILGSIGYGMGLAIALIAVNIFHVGQPALLYLVPCVLGPILIMAYVRGELIALWKGRGLEERETAPGGNNNINNTSDDRADTVVGA